MNKHFHFNKYYLVVAVFTFFLLLFIAFFIRDAYIRPYGGDFLVIIFLYTLVRSLMTVSILKAVLGVVLFSYVIEFLQFLKFLSNVGLENTSLSVALGSSFDWIDIALYTLAGIVILLFHYVRGEKLQCR